MWLISFNFLKSHSCMHPGKRLKTLFLEISCHINKLWEMQYSPERAWHFSTSFSIFSRDKCGKFKLCMSIYIYKYIHTCIHICRWGDEITYAYNGDVSPPAEPIHLREYPLQFGRAVVDLFDRMASTVAPPLPTPVPPATESFQALEDGGDETFGLDRANLKPVYDYLRRGKHLAIPAEWVPLIPRPS